MVNKTPPDPIQDLTPSGGTEIQTIAGVESES
jgi:hypothetical protein